MMETHSNQSIIFLDYQNLFFYLKGRLEGSTSPTEAITALLEGLRKTLAEKGIVAPTGFAYGDFASLDDHGRHVQRTLFLYGLQPIYVPSTMHRNTVDLQMAIDALRSIDSVPEADTYVFVSGDRDYVPLVQAILQQNRRVIVSAFRDHLSGHLLDNSGRGEFLYAEPMLSEKLRDHLDADEAPPPDTPVNFNTPTDLPTDQDYDALEVIEEFFGQYEEVYLTPLLRRLSEELGEAEGYDPKTLIAELENAGAVRLERRRGMPYDYTVLIVNSLHPAVVEIRAELRASQENETEDAPLIGNGSEEAVPS